jgi:glycosyltransferase involved in cell wall biosynthesis
MASGCPVVSTSVSESFLVSDSGGSMLADDVSSFSECIIQLASNPEMRRDLGQRGLEYAQGYDWNRLTERYETEVFTPCLSTLST